MPARRVFAWEPEEQWTSSEEREKKIEELSRELDESMDSNSGKGCLKAYLVKNEVWHIADIDYELRVDYKKYLKSTYSDSVVRSYLRGMDKAKLYAIRKHANTLKGKQEIAKNTDLIQELLFLPYHPNPAIAERYDCKVAIDKLVWDFRVNGSELCKRQLLEIIEDVVLRDIMLRECTMRLNGLKVVYQFCMQEHIEDILHRYRPINLKNMQIRHMQKSLQKENSENVRNIFSAMPRIFYGIQQSGIWKDCIWNNIESTHPIL